MVKLGIVGANGQVGAELCLMLAARNDIDLVPICRNRSGSAFLRWHGIACRHGRVTDDADAARLLSDCDVVVNSALATGAPAQIRRTEDQIIRNIFTHSPISATIIHFSTQSVYGDPTRNRRIRWRNPYGRAKLATEHQVHSESRRTRKPAFILRLGHVCGSMQEISNEIRASIRARSVTLPTVDSSSNTVYAAAVVGAILQIISGGVRPDTYDLMNTPRWTWREVYEYEAAACGLPLSPRLVDQSESQTFPIIAGARAMAGRLASAQAVRDLLAKLFAYAPESMNARATAWWYTKRARSEIAALMPSDRLHAHLSWVENGAKFFPAEQPTIALLRSMSELPTATGDWPADLPDAKRLLPLGRPQSA